MKGLANFKLTPQLLGFEKIEINGQDVTESVHAISLRLEEWQPAALVLEAKVDMNPIEGQGVIYVQHPDTLDLDAINPEMFEDAVIRKMEVLGCTYAVGALTVLKEMRDAAQSDGSSEVPGESDDGRVPDNS